MDSRFTFNLPTWTSVKHLSASHLIHVLQTNGIDASAAVRDLFAQGAIENDKMTKTNFEKVWRRWGGNRQAQRQVEQSSQKESRPFSETLLRLIYTKIWANNAPTPEDLQAHCMFTLAFFLCCKTNEIVLLRYSHIEWVQAPLEGAMILKLPWRVDERTLEVRPFYIKPIRIAGLEWLCPVRALRHWLNYLTEYKRLEELGDSYLFGVLKKRTGQPEFNNAMNALTLTNIVRKYVSMVNINLDAECYRPDCFRRGGILFYSRHDWSREAIISWLGCCQMAGARLDKKTANECLAYVDGDEEREKALWWGWDSAEGGGEQNIQQLHEQPEQHEQHERQDEENLE